jgi:hypothetical protein
MSAWVTVAVLFWLATLMAVTACSALSMRLSRARPLREEINSEARQPDTSNAEKS